MSDKVDVSGDLTPRLPAADQLHSYWFDAARGGQDEAIPALLRAGVAIDALDGKGHSALVLASYHGHVATTALLLREGAAVDGLPDVRGNTALMGVAFKGHAAIARLLIEAGAEVDRRNAAAQTALMTAALFNQAEIVELLVAAGADAALVDELGNSAGSVAVAQGHDDLAARLG